MIQDIPKIKEEIAEIRHRLDVLEGAFYQFQSTLENSERSSYRIYRFTLALIYLAIAGVLTIGVKVYFETKTSNTVIIPSTYQSVKPLPLPSGPTIPQK